jgi:hypothetical protein
MANHSQTNGSTISRDEGIAAPNDASQLDSAGQAILKLLDRAASAAEANRRQSLEAAQRILSQFHATQGRIAGLESELQFYREKADRAEDWLNNISIEIENRLIRRPEERRRRISGRS